MFTSQVQTQKKRQEEEDKQRTYRIRQQCLLGKGVSKEHIKLLPRDDRTILPSAILDDMQAFHLKLLKENREKEKEVLKTIFKRPWLERTEREMYKCEVQMKSSTTPPHKKTAILDYRDILSNKLKMFYRHFKMDEREVAVEERRKKCIEWGMLTLANQHLVKSVYQPLPVAQDDEEEEESSTNDELDDFDTQTPSQSILPRKRKASTQDPQD